MDDSAGRAILDQISRMLARADMGDERLFPPTELYGEGWMLRLLLDAAFRGAARLPFEPAADARWFSEAAMWSPFMGGLNSPSAHLQEGYTHADAMLGHFRLRKSTSAGFRLERDATQLMVIEAKMWSQLSSGTRRAPGYDQAARNVACMAWAIHDAGLAPTDLESVAFRVWAPAARIREKPSFREFLDRDSLAAKVERRVREFKCDPDRYADLDRWYRRSFLPLLERMDLVSESWEDLIDGVCEEEVPAIRSFYERCLRYNSPAGRRS